MHSKRIMALDYNNVIYIEGKPYSPWLTFESLTKAAEFIKDSKGNISLALNGKRKSVKGYHVKENK